MPKTCVCRGILRIKPALHGAAATWSRQVCMLLLPCAGRCMTVQPDALLCVHYLLSSIQTFHASCPFRAADIHSPATTVHEALLFSATLRLPEGVGPAAVRAFVREIERVVEVEDITHALVGMPGGAR